MLGAPELWSPSAAGSCDQPPAQEKTVAITTTYPRVVLVHGVNGTETKSQRSFKRAMKDFYVLDASKEGNVSRFINVSDDNTSYFIIKKYLTFYAGPHPPSLEIMYILCDITC